MKKTIITIALAVAATMAVADPLDKAIDAGNVLVQTLQTCLNHAKATHGDMKIPECNATKQTDAYLDAKSKVRLASPALEAIDQKQMILLGAMMPYVFGK